MTVSMGSPDSARHPLLDDLVGFVDGDLDASETASIAAHLATCDVCSATLAAISPPTTEFAGHNRTPLEAHSAETPLRLSDPTRLPLPGDVWSAQWEGDAYLVLIVDATSSHVDVMAASVESPSERTGLAQPMTLTTPGPTVFCWPAITAVLPIGVLAQTAGSVAQRSMALLTAGPPAIEADLQRSDLSLLWDLEAGLAELAGAAWIPVADPNAAPHRSLLSSRGLRPSTLAARTGLPAASWTEVLRSQRQPTDEEAAALAAILDVPVAQLRQPPVIPQALASVLENPMHRSQIRRHAETQRMPEADARIRVAERLLAVAARTTDSSRAEAVWEELLHHVLDD